MPSDTNTGGGAGWTRPSWFSPASGAIARGGTSSTSARASHRRRQRSRGGGASHHKSQRSNRRGSMEDGMMVGTYSMHDDEEDSDLYGRPRSAAGRRQRSRQQRPTPMLTVILMRLEASMTNYCHELSEPTASNARRAARVLDIDNLGTVAADPILEAEWIRMVDPLTLLAGAEGWYGGLEHLAQWQKQQSQQSQSQQKASAQSALTNDKTAGSRRQRSRIKRGTIMATDNMSSRRTNASSTSSAEVSFSGTNTEMPTPPTHDDDDNSNRPSFLSPEAERMRSIYGKVMTDLGILKEILCDPIVMTKPAVVSDESQSRKDDMRTEQPSSYLIPPAQMSDLESSAPRDAYAHSSAAGQQQQVAKSLSKTLVALAELCKVRREMIVIHSDIVALGSARSTPTKAETTGTTPISSGSMAVESLHSSLLGLAHRCAEIIKALPKDVTTASSSATAPLVESMRREITATKAALRMMAHLETCSFFETVLEAKRLETHLCPSSPFHSDLPCALEMWLRQMLREGLSLMSIYFDRIDAYANSSLGYGFQRHIMVEDKTGQQQLSKVPSAVVADTPSPAHPQGSPSPSSQGLASHSGQKVSWHGHLHDLDSEVIDFLQVHEERNGPALAVALLFDTKDCQGAFERGFSVKTKDTKIMNNWNEATSSSSGTEKASWSSVYLRTSIKSGDPEFEGKLEAGNAASLKRGGPRRAGSKGMSLSNLLSSGTENQGGLRIKRPSYGGNTSRGSLTSIVSDISLGLDGSEATKVVSPMVKAAEYGFLRATAGAANENEKPSSSLLAWPHSEMEGIVSILQSYDNASTKEASHSPHSVEPQKDTRSKNISPKFVASIHTPARPPRRNNPFNFSPLIEETEEQTLNESVIASPVRSITSSVTPPASPSNQKLSSPSGMVHRAGSSYHFLQIKERMWLSVVMKGDDEGGRHRRRTSRGGMTDEEIRMWLVQFAAKLPVNKMFCPKSVATARKVSKGLSLPAVVSSVSRGLVSSDEAVLMSLKESFGMKHSSSPLASRPLKSPYVRKESMSFRGTSIRSGSLPEQLIQDEGTSAAAFFLGADLGQALSPERHGMYVD